MEQVLSSVNGSPVGNDMIDTLLPNIMEDLKVSEATGKPRELRATLGRLLKSRIDYGSITEGILDTIFIQALNPPAIAFADKNYFDDNGLDNKHVSFLFNPITGNVELWDTLNTGDGFTPVCPTDQFYQETSWNMYTHPDFYPEIQEVAKED